MCPLLLRAKETPQQVATSLHEASGAGESEILITKHIPKGDWIAEGIGMEVTKVRDAEHWGQVLDLSDKKLLGAYSLSHLGGAFGALLACSGATLDASHSIVASRGSSRARRHCRLLIACSLLFSLPGCAVVDAHKDWCGPCKVMEPTYKRLSAEIEAADRRIAFASVRLSLFIRQRRPCIHAPRP
jgi:thiol-disulfide isomerase/thioredoxin